MDEKSKIMAQQLLTIAIPTYNRASFVEACLTQLLPQIKPYEIEVEIIVSDNASTDNTAEVVNKFTKNGYNIKYNRHSENLGMDGNFISVFENASGKYIWQLSDDDLAVNDAVRRVIEVLKSNEDIGVLYLNNLWFHSTVDYSKFDTNAPNNTIFYSNPLDYLRRVNYWVTFLSANIINKNLVEGKIDPYEFKGTSLALLSWTIRTVFLAKKNVVLENPVLACRAGGQGGYKFAQVFSTNFNSILELLVKDGYDKNLQHVINKSLLRNYFPPFVLSKKTGGLKGDFFYEKENWFSTFFNCYKSYLFYYIYLLPVFVFNPKIYYRYTSLIRRLGL